MNVLLFEEGDTIEVSQAQRSIKPEVSAAVSGSRPARPRALARPGNGPIP